MTIISGLIVGTLITLVFVPILYAFFFHIDRHEITEAPVVAHLGAPGADQHASLVRRPGHTVKRPGDAASGDPSEPIHTEN